MYGMCHCVSLLLLSLVPQPTCYWKLDGDPVYRSRFSAQPVHDESLGDESDGAVGRVERGHNVAGVAVNLEHKGK